MKSPTLVKDFKEFLLKSNMFALAMGVVMGTAISKVVDAIVADWMMPIVSFLTPSGDWRSMKVGHEGLQFMVGHFIGILIDFIIICIVIFIITKALMKPAPPSPSKKCSQCLESVHPDAKRCKYCTSAF
jgi:large conductance mechanosensitive channel